MATKWGIVGLGTAANDFANAVNTLSTEEHKIVCVAAHKLEKVQEFSSEHSVDKAYGNIEDLAEDADVEVVFIAVITSRHFKITKMMLNHGKHVLCQPPLAMTPAQVQLLADLAKSKKLFLMEAHWSRFFPLYQKVNRVVHKKKKIGPPLNIVMTMGKQSKGKRMTQETRAGGTVFVYGSNCIQLALMIFGIEKPKKIVASTVGLNDDGVDTGVSVSMYFSDSRVATFVTDPKAEMPSEATISGAAGTVKIGSRFWCPTEFTLIQKDEVKKTKTFPLPSGENEKFSAPNGIGLVYQVEEVRRCLKAGQLESPSMRLEESVLAAQISEEVNRQIGVKVDEK